MEREVKDLKEFLLKSGAKGLTPFEDVEEELKRSEVRESLKTDAQLSAPWLFSVQAGTPMTSIQVLLDFLPPQTAELDIKDWTREVLRFILLFLHLIFFRVICGWICWTICLMVLIVAFMYLHLFHFRYLCAKASES
eukprot:Blabericola_migrator_1__4037@NODE_2228_length_3093_cov_94_274950_g1404_i0_p2_GENE_NODE_2228_length_3093_cov_94_274950_g1404_i0NODE_2228_length_3093_cov_94_274950_g1404_i0_p2_ORF_typecomplete_len137_score21_76TctB/PF07331_11/0_022DUF3021/PF11457_8/0_058Pex24p/PF06398_11/0_292TM/PF13239_6/8_1e032TM/PF13239_6/0_37_NODE_2228_length_3093_cov_94_274950_g1404_i024272837